MARPTSWAGTSAAPVLRTASSTCWASWARASSSTGRPEQALRTPSITFARLNGSVVPERLRTASAVVSTVVKRRPHSGQARRRRIAAPSSCSRESTTRESGCRQNGQCTVRPLSPEPPTAGRPCGYVDGLWHNLWSKLQPCNTRCWGQNVGRSERARKRIAEDSREKPGRPSALGAARHDQLLAGEHLRTPQVVELLDLVHDQPGVDVRRDPRRHLPERLTGLHGHRARRHVRDPAGGLAREVAGREA